MSPDLPQYLEPARLADSAASLEGTLSLDNMDRLLAIVEERDAIITFRLSFSRNESGIIVINGDFSTDVVLRCQRCLEHLTLHLEKAIRVGCVANKSEAKALPGDMEPLQYDNVRIALAEFIEEEVLLGLPFSPVHEPAECSATEILQELRQPEESPFAVLGDLKSK